MARKTADAKQPEPEFTSYAILPAKDGGYVLRTSLIQGETVLAYEDETDTFTATIGKLMRRLSRVVR